MYKRHGSRTRACLAIASGLGGLLRLAGWGSWILKIGRNGRWVSDSSRRHHQCCNVPHRWASSRSRTASEWAYPSQHINVISSIQEGRMEGRKEGMKEGRKEGRKEGGPGYGTKGTLVLERIQYINPYVF